MKAGMDLKAVYDMGEQLCQMATAAGYSPGSEEGPAEEEGDMAQDPMTETPEEESYAAPKRSGSMLDTAISMMKKK